MKVGRSAILVLCAFIFFALHITTTCADDIKSTGLIVDPHPYYEEDDYFDYSAEDYTDAVVTGLPPAQENESVKQQDLLIPAAAVEITTEKVVTPVPSSTVAVQNAENSTLPEKQPLQKSTTTTPIAKEDEGVFISETDGQTMDDGGESSGSSQDETLSDDVPRIMPPQMEDIPYDLYDEDYVLGGDDDSVEQDQNDEKKKEEVEEEKTEGEEEGNKIVSSDEEKPISIFDNLDNDRTGGQQQPSESVVNDGREATDDMNSGNDDDKNNKRRFISPRFSFLPNWRDRMFSGVFIGFCALTFATILFMFYRGLVWYNQRSKTTTIMYQRMEEGGDPKFHQ